MARSRMSTKTCAIAAMINIVNQPEAPARQILTTNATLKHWYADTSELGACSGSKHGTHDRATPAFVQIRRW